MKRFAALYRNLDETTKTSRKIAALKEYFTRATPADAAWAVYFLSGRKPKRLIRASDLHRWAAEEAGVPDWLFDECYDAVGDMAETIALLLPEPEHSSDAPLTEWVERLLGLRDLGPDEQRERLVAAWRELDTRQRMVWNKLITGAFRVGVSQTLVIRALAEVGGVPSTVVSHRLMGAWEPTPEFYQSLLATETTETVDVSKPYPFCLAHPLEGSPDALGDVRDWLAEWKWDGIRAQCIRRGGETAIWSRGEELLTERFPELLDDAARLPDGTVLDGEIVGWKDGAVMPFGALQRRIGRKALGKKILADVPVRFIVFDVLEHDGQDVRDRPLRERRAILDSLISMQNGESKFMASPVEQADTWDELAAQRTQSRGRNVEGLMLKRLDAPYGVGRVTGIWWKWKIAPHTIDAVLIYAQPGSGRRASLFTDYTFGIWHEGELVPFAKAYSGLSDEEIREVDGFVRRNTLEKFGPVRRVKPELVFELAFENVELSTRHKAGIAVRFPRMVRRRTDKRPEEADTLDGVKSLLRSEAEKNS